ncbi:MAG TPA: cyclic nucleotide-binding domain-containing protein [Chloroflexia bacterium]|nr:cyclic nucleotide-binding domain-containing protein [Chloroflexia bacterium]
MDVLSESLKRVPILAALKPEHIDMLAKLVTNHTYNKGDVIIKQGDPGAGLFVILNGSVSVTAKTRPGLPETKLSVLGKGDFFGEMSMIDGYPRSATVTALAETQAVELDRWAFLDALRREPSIAVAMLPVLTRRIRALEEAKR